MQIFVGRTLYIGHVITKNGVKPDEAKTAAITAMKPPTDKVRQFLGHVNYLYKFITQRSVECEPLRRLVGANPTEFV